MDDADDPIKKLLEQTGWSYAEILAKLEKYKNNKPQQAAPAAQHTDLPENETNSATSNDSKTNDAETQENENNKNTETDGCRDTGVDQKNENDENKDTDMNKEDIITTEDPMEHEKQNEPQSKDSSETSQENEKDFENSKEENMITGNSTESSNKNCQSAKEEEHIENENDSKNNINSESNITMKDKDESNSISFIDSADLTQDAMGFMEETVVKSDNGEELITIENQKSAEELDKNAKLEVDNTTDQSSKKNEEANINESSEQEEDSGIASNKNKNTEYEYEASTVTEREQLKETDGKEDEKENTKTEDISIEDKEGVNTDVQYNEQEYTETVNDENAELQNTKEESSADGKEVIRSPTNESLQSETIVEEATKLEECTHQVKPKELFLNNIKQIKQRNPSKGNLKKKKTPLHLKNTSKLGNERLRLMQKYKNILKKGPKKKAESNSKTEEPEDIRIKLKEQLELLRTRRKTPEPPLTPTKPSCSITFPQHNKNRLDTITTTLLQKLNKHVAETNNCTSEDTNLESDLNTIDSPNMSVRAESPENILSNESSFMIVNVVGGYKSPTPETKNDDDLVDIEGSCSLVKQDDTDSSKDIDRLDNDTSNSWEASLTASGIKPTKTNDVTKIKGWKNKKFAIAKAQTKPSEKLLQLLTTDCEYHAESTQMSLDKEESNSSHSENLENSNSIKSAFISDTLDQFLNENSELNISYEVPQLKAEQTITKTYIDIKFPEFPQEIRKPSLKKNKDTYKPKTLAEKRKMLTESQAPEIRDFMVSLSSKQRKDYEESVLKMRNKLIEENVPFTRRCFMASTSITNTASFVVRNGKKYRVPCSKSKKIIVEYKDRRKKYKCAPQLKNRCLNRFLSKPSLLKSLKVDEERVKIELNPEEWETIHVKLPKLSLEVTPKIGKHIDPKIEHLLPYNDTTITPERLEFALTMLKVHGHSYSGQKFTFPLSYASNQKSVLMRRKLVPNIPEPAIEPTITETDEKITESVNEVMNNLLDYIEISEATKDIVQEETNPENNEISGLLLEQTDNISETKHKGRKRKPLYGPKSVRTTTLEMKRLNCKIVSISLDEQNNEKPCQKEFCKLGCICKSIECNSNFLPSHCGLLNCMFECACNYKNTVGQNVSLPPGTSIFSDGIINRLREEANKNLAKVEKEFTQTIIKTNNQIIIVGDSKERRKRATKMPKKYDDYVEEDFEEHLPPKPLVIKKKYTAATKSITNYKDDIIIKPCFVKLLKLDLSDIIPFCWVHTLYKCHCKNKAVFDSGAGDINIVGCKVLKSSTPPAPKPGLIMKNRIRNDKTFNKEIYSSRTRGLSTSYYIIRNKSLSHKTKLLKSSRSLQKHLEAYLRHNADKIMEGADEQPPPDTSIKQIAQGPVPNESRRKRKQSLVVLEDAEIDNVSITSETELNSSQQNGSNMEREPKIQRRKIRISTKQEFASITKNNQQSLLKNVLTNTGKGKKDFLALLSKKNAQLRLLPWSTLATRYENGSFQLWYSNYLKSPQLIITENGKRPSTNYYNIKLFENMYQASTMPSDIIRWLISKTIPLGKTGDQILLILAYNKSYWKICGVCERTCPDPLKPTESISISLIEAYCSVDNPPTDEEQAAVDPNTKDKIEDPQEVYNNTKENQDEEEEHTETLVHENLQENKKVMYCSRRRFQPKKLISDGIHDDVLKIRQVLWAPIPGVTLACKWRVICMNLGFAYLSLSRSSYTIKYDDIMKAVKLAQAEKVTIVLKSEELQKNYPHRNFGIYCVHNYSDKIFVGPYFLNENHDLDTLSFVNSVLVNTNLFNQIKGKTVPGSGFWFHQVTNSEDKNIDDDIAIIHKSPVCIDLTCDSDEESIDVQNSLPQKLRESPLPKETALLNRMLNTVSYDSDEEETVKAEKALDTLLKTGQLNVNKTIVQNAFAGLKSLPKTDQGQIISKTSKVAPKSPSSHAIDETRDSSEWDDDKKLVIDEGNEVVPNLNQPLKDEVADSSKLSVDHETENTRRRYLITNVPKLGYILAYVYEKGVDVICPITQKTKRFPKIEVAVTALERVLAKRFIMVPPTFKLRVSMMEKVDDAATAPLDRAVLNGYHIVGAFGVKNILNSNAVELKEFGLDKTEIGQALLQREQKLLLPPISELAKLLKIPLTVAPLSECLANVLEGTLKEIKTLQKDKVTFTNEKIDLETKKIVLAEKCSKLIANLPLAEQFQAQQELDRIISFSTKDATASVSRPSPLSSPKPDNAAQALQELKMLQKDEVSFTNEKIDLEAKKALLAAKCSKLIANLAPGKRFQAQQDLDQIISFSSKDSSTSVSRLSPLGSPNSDKVSISVEEKPEVLQEDESEPVVLLDDSNDAPNTADCSKSVPKSELSVLLPTSKVKLTRSPSVGNACTLVPNKKVEITGQVSMRSLLNGNITTAPVRKDNLTNKFVVLTQKRNAAGKIIDVSNVSLNKRTFQIKPSHPNEKVLVKELPIMVRRNMIKTINGKSQQKTIAASANIKSHSTNDVSVPKSVLSTVSSLNTFSKIVPTTLGSVLTTNGNSVSAVQSISASSVIPVNSLSVSKPQLINLSTPGSPYMCIPLSVASKPVKSNSDVKNNSMATITPMSKSVVTNNAATKSSPNYIAFKNGNNTKYFQLLVTEAKVPGIQPVQAIKRPASSVMVQPPAKKQL